MPLYSAKTGATDVTFAEGKNIITGATTGTKIGTATSQKVGFYNATPVVRPTAYTQTYSTADKTHAALVSTAVATTGATNVTSFGYTTSAQANDIPTQINNCRTDITEVKDLLNAVIDDLQAIGLLG